MTELSADARALTAAVRKAERPDPGARQRIRARLFAAIGGGTTLGALPAAAAVKSAAGVGAASAAGAASGAAGVGGGAVVGVTAGKVALWVALGAGVGTASMASVYGVEAAWHSTPSAVEPPPAAMSAASAVVSAPPTAATGPVEATLAPAPASAALPTPPIAARSSSPPASSTLAEERGLIQHAQVALRDGDPGRALALLDQHAQRFPAGVLAQERQAVRVLALCRQGRLDAAREEADRLAASAPGSPLVPRVLRSCGFDR